MVPPLPTLSQNANATLHALTERLASHGKGLSPLLTSGFANSLTSHSFAAAAQAYRQPAPPPQLPVLQLVSRHQEPGSSSGNGGQDVPSRCPEHKKWPASTEHSDNRCSRCGEEEMEGFVWDMGVVLRREFDCWVEQCWCVEMLQAGLTIQGRSVSPAVYQSHTDFDHPSHYVRLITAILTSKYHSRRSRPGQSLPASNA